MLFSILLLFSVYGLGRQLLSPPVGLLAAALCQLLPGLYRYRTEFVLDYPVTAIVTFSFFSLTLWKQSACDETKPERWLWGVLVGFAIGLGLMIKQTVVLFLFFPILWLFLITIRKRKWENLIQFLIGLLTALLIAFPWYKTNWLLILTSGKRATVDSAIAEGDPALNTLDAWLYYGKVLPYLLSWHLLLIPFVCFLIYGTQWLIKHQRFDEKSMQTVRWLGIFLIGGYFLSSLNLNKDARYILPLLPVLSLIIAQGLFFVSRKWRFPLIASTLGLGFVLMILNLFPLNGDWITEILSPRVQHYPVMGKAYPHQDVVAEMVETSPYLRHTLGVLPSTPTINQHNFSFYGAQANFQVYGRQVGVEESNIEQDARSLRWFITKTGEQGSIPSAQKLITERIETGNDFSLRNTWTLPDQSLLKLYQQKQPTVTVIPIENSPSTVHLTRVEVPERIPKGVPIPVDYTWEGNGEALQQGIVLLTWEGTETDHFWLHDHGIAMGGLVNHLESGLKVEENTAMLIPPDTPKGNYTLRARYLNRETGETYPLETPSLSVTVDTNATAPPAPELDLVTQLRTAAVTLPEGESALEDIFAQTGRINQYDPIQDYLQQSEIALKYRLQMQEERLDWLYPLALSEVLQQDADGAIAQFKKITELDSENPYAYAYLAFVHLYLWQPHAAETALNTALQLNPNLDILHTLDGVAALMQGNLIKAYQKLTSDQ
ncbi:glycosyltransferase family 39 protein [Halothece sp. PCC 7418]|uniref:glycosyltransferase family 39 protein n=1 Tax=Halothece sp. (strain PCC 7418) TaxID=65093 RepID=UPI001F48F524|nr:glycosyltransferase family 39 protein [Halothece sp. PCC 7418]